MKNLFIPAMSLLAIVLFSCRKERSAGFETDREEMFLGQPVSVTNTSVGMKHYRWDFGDESDRESEITPAPHIYDTHGTYTIKLEASHRKSMGRSEVYTRDVHVTSWTITGIRIEKMLFKGWDASSGPDVLMKINDPEGEFSDVFYADHAIFFPDNLDSTDLPVEVKGLNITLNYADWNFRLLEQDIPLPNTSMRSWLVNPYESEDAGEIRIVDNDYDIALTYQVNE